MKPADYLPGLILPESFVYYIYQQCQEHGETDRQLSGTTDKSQAAIKRFVTMNQIT